jgi:hypothetical protein
MTRLQKIYRFFRTQGLSRDEARTAAKYLQKIGAK